MKPSAIILSRTFVNNFSSFLKRYLCQLPDVGDLTNTGNHYRIFCFDYNK